MVCFGELARPKALMYSNQLSKASYSLGTQAGLPPYKHTLNLV